MRREFVIAEQEDEHGEVILSLAALEVRRTGGCALRLVGWTL